ncbi:hypothetical protein L208DRAFT_1255979 [Tricholoma matsutake]|nr:hypothetical protein L208DRAFT_1255979 [Tricholoma matsutake 945]
MPSTNRGARTRHQVAHGDPLLYTNANFADFDDNYLPEFRHVSLSGWDSDVANQFHNLWAEDDSSDLPDDDDGSATGGDIDFIPGLTELASQETINRFLASQRNAWRQMAWELFTTTWRLSEPMSAELAAAGLPLDLTSPAAFRASYAARQAAHAELHHGEPSSSSRRRRPRGPRAQQRRY